MKRKRGKLALKILFVLSVGIMIPASLIAPNVPKAFLPLLRELSKRIAGRPFNIRRSLTYLKKNRLIRTIQKGEETTIVITEKGKQRLLRGNMDQLTIPQPAKWDRKWRVIIFDIPEHKKNAREALRNKIKELGFYQLQKSCFVYPFECRDQIDFICELFEISQYVNYIMAESIEGKEQLQQYFEL